jgi:hypothetical protein
LVGKGFFANVVWQNSMGFRWRKWALLDIVYYILEEGIRFIGIKDRVGITFLGNLRPLG